MSNDKNIFGCFVSITHPSPIASQADKDLAIEQGTLFRNYIWGENGIDKNLKKLKRDDYGKDLELALLQFYVNPIQYELENLKEIESYRKKEKSIGIPIIINDENFFNRSDEERYSFLAQSILQKMDLLSEVVKKKKLDTKIGLLKADLEKILAK
ncbi:hypothetical protein [Chryseobacterium taihuense]|uniref:Uncharacterized protein n=1 Tax=Chryseobacterium taihuense TaxID=1141221 RepID=A0ABY0QZF8_9FLAO|nr:hypothetical protein [Chryseobacterium taihuense]SDM14677.1 hypothetical protein SAMN05216273_11496 [Chryseobacterium taihuense]